MKIILVVIPSKLYLAQKIIKYKYFPHRLTCPLPPEKGQTPMIFILQKSDTNINLQTKLS